LIAAAVKVHPGMLDLPAPQGSALVVRFEEWQKPKKK